MLHDNPDLFISIYKIERWMDGWTNEQMDDWKRGEVNKKSKEEERKEGGKDKERNTNIWESNHIIFSIFNDINGLELNGRNKLKWSSQLQINVAKLQEILVPERALQHSQKITKITKRFQSFILISYKFNFGINWFHAMKEDFSSTHLSYISSLLTFPTSWFYWLYNFYHIKVFFF